MPVTAGICGIELFLGRSADLPLVALEPEPQPRVDLLALMPPAYMATLADRAGSPEGIADWDDEDDRIASHRLLCITTNGAGIEYCVSPDLPAGEIALVYEADVDPQDFGRALDELMVSYLESD